MYRRPKFLEVLLEIRQEMSREADYDVDLFAEKIRTGSFPADRKYDLSVENETEKPDRREIEKPKLKIQKV